MTTAKTAPSQSADETAAQALLKEMQEAMGKNDIAGAKTKYAEIEKSSPPQEHSNVQPKWAKNLKSLEKQHLQQ